MEPDAFAVNKIREMDQTREFLDSDKIDLLLGLGVNSTEKTIDNSQLYQVHGSEQFTYQGTPYVMIRAFLRILQPRPDDIVYDLGSGYGRVVFYGAITTSARYRGIEIVPERIKECRKIQYKLSLPNVDFLQGNVLEKDYDDGTIFFLFNPFCDETLEQVVFRLHSIHENHPIKVVSWGGPSDRYLSSQDWLMEYYPRELSKLGLLDRLRFFKSR